MLCLVAAKVANVYVPIFYKKAVDLLTGDAATIAALPIALLLAYGGARVLAVVFAELREALFAKLAQRAIRTAALPTFRHLPALGLRSHLHRRPGRSDETRVGIECVCTFYFRYFPYHEK